MYEYYVDSEIAENKATEIESLGPTQSEIFIVVSKNGPITSREVADILHKRCNTGTNGMQSRVSILSRRGLLKRKISDKPLPYELTIDPFIKLLHPFELLDREIAAIISHVLGINVGRSTVSRKRRNLGLPSNRYARTNLKGGSRV